MGKMYHTQSKASFQAENWWINHLNIRSQGILQCFLNQSSNDPMAGYLTMLCIIYKFTEILTFLCLCVWLQRSPVDVRCVGETVTPTSACTPSGDIPPARADRGPTTTRESTLADRGPTTTRELILADRGPTTTRESTLADRGPTTTRDCNAIIDLETLHLRVLCFRYHLVCSAWREVWTAYRLSQVRYYKFSHQLHRQHPDRYHQS